jgi:hypothetical protein
VENNSEQPVNQQAPAQQPVNEIPHSKNRFKLILLITILLLIIGVGAYLLSANQSKFLSQFFQKLIPTSVPKSPTPAPNSTANWKTYVNKEYGFEIKFPQGWSVDEKIPMYKNSRIIQIGTDDQYDQFYAGLYIGISINSDNLSLDQWAENHTKPDSDISTVELMGDVILDKQPAKKFSSVSVADMNISITAIHNKYIYTISFPDIDSYKKNSKPKPADLLILKTMFEQMLSTFKFTD